MERARVVRVKVKKWSQRIERTCSLILEIKRNKSIWDAKKFHRETVVQCITIILMDSGRAAEIMLEILEM